MSLGVQTSYVPISDTPAFAGMPVYACGYKTSAVRQAEATEHVPFGVFVAQGTEDTDVILPATYDAVIRGVSVFTQEFSHDSADDDGILPNTQMTIGHEGTFWVLVEDVVEAFVDRLYVRWDGTGQQGAARGSAVTDETIDLTACGVFVTSTTGTFQLAQVRINMVNQPATPVAP